MIPRRETLMILMLSTWEIVAILVVVLVLFGNRIPGMARSLGSGITEFKKGLKDGSKTDAGASTPEAKNDGSAR
jgi:sec-independent protein translocase protein TatA